MFYTILATGVSVGAGVFNTERLAHSMCNDNVMGAAKAAGWLIGASALLAYQLPSAQRAEITLIAFLAISTYVAFRMAQDNAEWGQPNQLEQHFEMVNGKEEPVWREEPRSINYPAMLDNVAVGALISFSLSIVIAKVVTLFETSP